MENWQNHSKRKTLKGGQFYEKNYCRSKLENEQNCI